MCGRLSSYLGATFSADGDNMTDIRVRIAMARNTAGKLRNIWSSKWIPLRLKLRIYVTGVCTQLVYGSEAWNLDEEATHTLNGANSRMLHRITGRTIQEEASKDKSFDLVR